MTKKENIIIPLLFGLAAIIMVISLPREGQFKYQYQKGSPWMYENLDATFDFPVLNKTLDFYNLPTPDYNKFCTYKIYRSNLATLCKEHNIPLNHHDALSDAKACAELWLRSLEN